jgi:hypothetical protein
MGIGLFRTVPAGHEPYRSNDQHTNPPIYGGSHSATVPVPDYGEINTG